MASKKSALTIDTEAACMQPKDPFPVPMTERLENINRKPPPSFRLPTALTPKQVAIAERKRLAKARAPRIISTTPGGREMPRLFCQPMELLTTIDLAIALLARSRPKANANLTEYNLLLARFEARTTRTVPPAPKPFAKADVLNKALMDQ